MRTANRTGRETCEWCEHGLAVVSTRMEGNTQVEEFGPCPWCELGAEKEFPEKRKPHWGRDGYWRGQTPVVQRPLNDGVSLSGRENKLRVRLLIARMGGLGVDPAMVLDKPEKERVRLLEAACAALHASDPDAAQAALEAPAAF